MVVLGMPERKTVSVTGLPQVICPGVLLMTLVLLPSPLAIRLSGRCPRG